MNVTILFSFQLKGAIGIIVYGLTAPIYTLGNYAFDPLPIIYTISLKIVFVEFGVDGK